MDNLFIEGKGFIPHVSLDANSGVLNFSGQSYHEYTDEFFEPIFDWLKEFFDEPGKDVTLNFKMTYFNTASSKCILEILDMTKEYEDEKEGNVTANWFYQASDYDMLEAGEDYIADTDLEMNLIPD